MSLCGIVYAAAVFCVDNLQVIAVSNKVWSRLDKSERVIAGKRESSLHNVKRLNDEPCTGLKSSNSAGLAGRERWTVLSSSVFFS